MRMSQARLWSNLKTVIPTMFQEEILKSKREVRTMNRYFKEFFHRGLMFGGFGPVVVSIIYVILENCISDFSLNAAQVCLAVISSYILAFVQAGVSVFNQIESWSVPKALLCHFSMLYTAYLLCYVLNSWIPFKVEVLLVFTAIFVAVYLVIWVSVYLAVKATSRKMNVKLK